MAQILAGLSMGLTNAEIAASLSMSEFTAKEYVKTLLPLARARTRDELAEAARRGDIDITLPAELAAARDMLRIWLEANPGEALTLGDIGSRLDLPPLDVGAIVISLKAQRLVTAEVMVSIDPARPR